MSLHPVLYQFCASLLSYRRCTTFGTLAKDYNGLNLKPKRILHLGFCLNRLCCTCISWSRCRTLNFQVAADLRDSSFLGGSLSLLLGSALSSSGLGLVLPTPHPPCCTPPCLPSLLLRLPTVHLRLTSLWLCFLALQGVAGVMTPQG